jgi:hypothetical protein
MMVATVTPVTAACFMIAIFILIAMASRWILSSQRSLAIVASVIAPTVCTGLVPTRDGEFFSGVTKISLSWV